MLHILNGIIEWSNMEANVLPLDPPSTLAVKRSNFNFLEHGFVAYQIKGNHGCNNSVAKILLADTPPPDNDFPEHGHVAYQIKGNHEMQQHRSKYFVHSPLHLTPGPLRKRSKFFFFRTWSNCISNIRVSRMQQHGDPRPMGWGQ